ncbi:hypothetical protein AAY86_14370 [Pseudomonas amygdali pv. tabaci str. ATCC 11528]|uniref:DUF4381 domain-containing protein n=20 Tax=Pseudomonas syringae group TaxID=136849 RepID=A0A0N8T1M4_PSEAJ|nr:MULTISPECIES: DUF4381 domain-containing protein [Pseudomonas]EGH21906.1 hypothetical protein PSYMO_10520 [Pseudomonas amygdali pv. mori str. 301020]KPB83144.1 Uncharacterized protein AC504_4175 [Pseudomonas syringae pv. maculicola]KPW48781.1 Uncharacterized protein ALO82_01706 [Pseudomonas syringae pv. broussonetiae]KPX08548.1 Uncharacterized protein ALO74_01133 [Pseudomonas syringae pv. cunninghamiae]KPX58711.1 Uncharacterized protein ALO35_01654 [Pseudomonas amygdali pv. lachrymans]
MNPLDQLEPLIAPEAVGFWPLAPGWWLLLLLIPAAGWGLWRLRVLLPVKARKVRSEQPLDPVRLAALAELASLPKPYDGAPAGAWLQQINGLLKRLCRNHYPHSQSHTLNGRKWLAFLDNRCPAAGLTRWMILVEGAYKPECKLDDKAITGLTQAVDTWIRKHV